MNIFIYLCGLKFMIFSNQAIEMKYYALFLLLLLPCFAGKSYAQSLYDKQRRVIATKINNEQINVTGSTFLIEEGRMIEVLDGVRREDLGINYIRQTDGNRIEYINKESQLVGYYVPSENRFYRVEVRSGKVDHVALLYEGQVYTLDEQPVFRIDASFPPEWIGCVLFFFLGY